MGLGLAVLGATIVGCLLARPLGLELWLAQAKARQAEIDRR